MWISVALHGMMVGMVSYYYRGSETVETLSAMRESDCSILVSQPIAEGPLQPLPDSQPSQGAFADVPNCMPSSVVALSRDDVHVICVNSVLQVRGRDPFVLSERLQCRGGAPGDHAASLVTKYVAPRVKTKVLVQYPAEAKRYHREGTTILSLRVSVQGRPGDVRVEKSSGMIALDKAALESVRQWTFEPAILNGRPVSAFVRLPVSFRFGQ